MTRLRQRMLEDLQRRRRPTMVPERGDGLSEKFASRNQFEIRGRSKRETKCTSVTLRILVVCIH
jgi:hypothetical protein